MKSPLIPKQGKKEERKNTGMNNRLMRQEYLIHL